MSNIRRDDGTPYMSDADRNEGIVSYYESIYRKPPDDHVDYIDCVSNFLGRRITNHQIVQNSKLSEEEKDRLDRLLLVSELDDAVAKFNVHSAPGIDGLSYLFIKKYWQFLRVPLLKYANHCFLSGCLTTNFRSAAIKLIPKKAQTQT